MEDYCFYVAVIHKGDGWSPEHRCPFSPQSRTHRTGPAAVDVQEVVLHFGDLTIEWEPLVGTSGRDLPVSHLNTAEHRGRPVITWIVLDLMLKVTAIHGITVNILKNRCVKSPAVVTIFWKKQLQDVDMFHATLHTLRAKRTLTCITEYLIEENGEIVNYWQLRHLNYPPNMKHSMNFNSVQLFSRAFRESVQWESWLCDWAFHDMFPRWRPVFLFASLCTNGLTWKCGRSKLYVRTGTKSNALYTLCQIPLQTLGRNKHITTFGFSPLKITSMKTLNIISVLWFLQLSLLC